MKKSKVLNKFKYLLVVSYGSSNYREYYFEEIEPMENFYNEYCIKMMNYARGYENLNIDNKSKKFARWKKILEPDGEPDFSFGG